MTICLLQISGGSDEYALLWNPFSERHAGRLAGHSCSLIGLHTVARSPQVVTGDRSGVFKVWDLRTLETVQSWTCSPFLAIGAWTVRGYTTIPAKRRIVVSNQRRFQVFDFAFEHNPELTDDQAVVFAEYNETLSSIITAAGTGLRLWDAASGSLVKVFRNVVQGEVTAVCLDERGRKLFCGDQSGRMRCINIVNGHVLKELEPHDAEVSSLVYNKGLDRESVNLTVFRKTLATPTTTTVTTTTSTTTSTTTTTTTRNFVRQC